MLHRAHRKSFSLRQLEDPSPAPYVIEETHPTCLSEKLSYPLIRPLRYTYNEQLLAPPVTKNGIMEHEEVNIPFKLSLYKPKNMRYVVLYLHGNSASRFQGHSMLLTLPKGAGLACFDFSACGNRRDSQFVTLGQNQSKDVDTAAKYLKSRGYLVAGWGRSMGAVSLLLSTQIDVLVVDSPYCSLQTLIESTAHQNFPKICCCFLHCIYPCIYSWIKAEVQEKAGLQIEKMEIAERMKENPRNKERKIFFISGNQDTTIPVQHTKSLYQKFTGVKKLRIFEGTHNSVRSKHLIGQCHDFIEHHLRIENPEPMGVSSPTRLGKNSSSTRLVKVKSERKPVKTQRTAMNQTNNYTLPLTNREDVTLSMKQQGLEPKRQSRFSDQDSMQELIGGYTINVHTQNTGDRENCEQLEYDKKTQIL